MLVEVTLVSEAKEAAAMASVARRKNGKCGIGMPSLLLQAFSKSMNLKLAGSKVFQIDVKKVQARARTFYRNRGTSGE